ncbi:glutathione binding-like protein [Vibrio sp. AK197]|uniref:Glutathione binding-like protein n=1 Tax=Vibrio olivae TaxID=1243002 RepID=A0ABV5HI08_9VIBR
MTHRVQLYSLATPNGQKVAIALEEMALEYDAHAVDSCVGDQFVEEFLSINPNNKIPAIVDPVGDHGQPHAVMESGAILIYLAEKTGLFLPQDAIRRSQTLQWLCWQIGGLGPMLAQYGHFSYSVPVDEDVSYAQARYRDETQHLLNVLEKHLEGKVYIIGDELTIADFAIMPWIVCLEQHFQAGAVFGLDQYTNIKRWVERLLARPATARAMTVCALESLP